MGSALERERRSAIEYHPIRHRARHRPRACGSLCSPARDRRPAAHRRHHRRGHRGHARKEREAPVTTPLTGYLLVAALLFAIGLGGALVRRNAILVLIGIELMLNAANLNLIAFWRYGPHPEALTGMMFAIFSIAVAAAKAAVGLGLVIAIYRHTNTTELDKIDRMKGRKLDPGIHFIRSATRRVLNRAHLVAHPGCTNARLRHNRAAQAAALQTRFFS